MDARLQIARAFEPLRKPARYKVFYGGRGGAKSWAYGLELISQSLQRPLRILCARELQISIADSVHKLLGDLISRLKLDPYFEITKTQIRSLNGSEFIFKGLRHNAQEIKSLEGVDICWVEEAQSVSRESWELLIPTIRKEGSEIWISFNPGSPDDETYKRFVVSPPSDAVVVKVGWQDNPWFPATLDRERQYCKEVDPEAYEHIWGGEPRTISDAQIFKGRFEVEAFETPSDARFFHGADWGFAKDPTALVRMFVMKDALYIDAEAYGVGVELDELPTLFDSIPTSRSWPIKADSARPETISYMARKGFRIVAAKKWAGSVMDGIALLKSFRKIVIHPRCKHAADEFRLYSYKVDKTNDDILPIPVDANNHCIAKGELVTTMRGNIPIEDVLVGDKVFTRDGWHTVIASNQTGLKPVITVQSGKSTVKCTPDHKVYTVNRGFVEAGKLTGGDILCQLSKQFYATDLYGGVTLNQNGEATAYITNAQKITNLFGCIDMSGKRSTEKFLLGIMSIIRTGILTIMTYRIWNASLLKNIVGGILLQKNNWNGNTNISLKSAIAQRIGIVAKKAVNAIVVSVGWLTRTLCPEQTYAYSVAGSSPAISLETRTSFVQTPASQNGDVCKDLMMFNASVNGAAKHSWPTNTESNAFVQSNVLSITQPSSEKIAVYDLTVEGAHEFFVNGILVHNCIDAARYALDGYVSRPALNINPAVLRQPLQQGRVYA